MIDRPDDVLIAAGGPRAEVPPPIPSLDVRGWEVVLADGSILGVIDSYLLDGEARRARYLAVTAADRDGYLIIPIGIGALDPDRRRLKLKKPRADRLRALPLVAAPIASADALAPDVERAVYAAVTGRRVSRVAWPHRYRDPVFDSSRLFARSRRETPA